MPKKITLENHLTAEQLYQKYRRSQHPQEKLRWQALALIAKGGVANQVVKKLGRSSGWISETVRRYNEGGAAAVKNKSKNQQSRTLSGEQEQELEKLIESGKTRNNGLWTSRQVKNWVEEQTGSRIHKTTAWRMMIKLEFSPQTVRPAHQEKASDEEQADFKKN